MDPALDDIARQLDAFLWPDGDPRQARKRERILAAATERFVRHGYRKTSIDEVARAAGVAKGTIYLYYRSKPELLFHAVAHEKRRYLERLAPLETAADPRERLRSFITLGIVMKPEMPLVARLTGGDHEFAQAMQEVDAAVLQGINELQVSLTTRLVDEASGGSWAPRELERRAQVLIDVMFAVLTSEPMVQRELPLEEYARLLADILVTGVVGPAAEPIEEEPETWTRRADSA